MKRNLNHFAKKSLGQNFLKSEKALSQIVDAGNIQKGDLILEIGPGEGALTSKILEKIELSENGQTKSTTQLVAVEKDDRLIPILEEKFKEYTGQINNTETKEGNKSNPKKQQEPLLKIIHGDIIELLEKGTVKNLVNQHPNKTYKVIANIPYYITGLILRKIFEEKNLPVKVVLLVQKEVADRIVAIGDNGKFSTTEDRNGAKESLLSLSIKIYGTPKRVAVVPRGAFVPAPTVDSAIISIENIERKIDQTKEVLFFELLHSAFSHKRKRLAKNLMSLIEGTIKNNDDFNIKHWKFNTSAEVEKVLTEINLDKNIRAEDLSVEKYIQLLDRLV